MSYPLLEFHGNIFRTLFTIFRPIRSTLYPVFSNKYLFGALKGCKAFVLTSNCPRLLPSKLSLDKTSFPGNNNHPENIMMQIVQVYPFKTTFICQTQERRPKNREGGVFPPPTQNLKILTCFFPLLNGKITPNMTSYQKNSQIADRNGEGVNSFGPDQRFPFLAVHNSSIGDLVTD